MLTRTPGINNTVFIGLPIKGGPMILQMKYALNQKAIVLLDSDRNNGLITIAFNPITDEIYAIRPKEYTILKQIHDQELRTDVSDEVREIVMDLTKKQIILKVDD